MNEFSHLKNKLLAEQVEDQIYHYILDTPIEPGARVGYLRSDNHQGPVRPAGPAFRQG